MDPRPDLLPIGFMLNSSGNPLWEFELLPRLAQSGVAVEDVGYALGDLLTRLPAEDEEWRESYGASATANSIRRSTGLAMVATAALSPQWMADFVSSATPLIAQQSSPFDARTRCVQRAWNVSGSNTSAVVMLLVELMDGQPPQTLESILSTLTHQNGGQRLLGESSRVSELFDLLETQGDRLPQGSDQVLMRIRSQYDAQREGAQQDLDRAAIERVRQRQTDELARSAFRISQRSSGWTTARLSELGQVTTALGEIDFPRATALLLVGLNQASLSEDRTIARNANKQIDTTLNSWAEYLRENEVGALQRAGVSLRIEAVVNNRARRAHRFDGDILVLDETQLGELSQIADRFAIAFDETEARADATRALSARQAQFDADRLQQAGFGELPDYVHSIDVELGEAHIRYKELDDLTNNLRRYFLDYGVNDPHGFGVRETEQLRALHRAIAELAPGESMTMPSKVDDYGRVSRVTVFSRVTVSARRENNGDILFSMRNSGRHPSGALRSFAYRANRLDQFHYETAPTISIEVKPTDEQLNRLTQTPLNRFAKGLPALQGSSSGETTVTAIHRSASVLVEVDVHELSELFANATGLPSGIATSAKWNEEAATQLNADLNRSLAEHGFVDQGSVVSVSEGNEVTVGIPAGFRKHRPVIGEGGKIVIPLFAEWTLPLREDSQDKPELSVSTVTVQLALRPAQALNTTDCDHANRLAAGLGALHDRQNFARFESGKGVWRGDSLGSSSLVAETTAIAPNVREEIVAEVQAARGNIETELSRRPVELLPDL